MTAVVGSKVAWWRRPAWAAVAFFSMAAIILIAFRVAPVVIGAVLSFTDWNGLGSPVPVGIEQYVRVFQDPLVRGAALNNLIILATLPIWVALPLILAIGVRELPRFGQVVKLALLVPMLLAPAVLGLMFVRVLSLEGPANQLLSAIGLDQLAQGWLTGPTTAFPTFIAILIWSAVGTGVLFYTAGLADLDVSVEEAAMIDGAGWWRRLWSVVIPHLRPVIEFWAIICIINIFTATFPLLYTMTAGGPGRATTTLDLLIFQIAFGERNLGYANALAMSVFAVVLIIVSVYLVVSRRFAEDED